MGNTVLATANGVRLFASSQSWVEDAATRQLHLVATRPGIRAVAGMPDLHPGKYGPVGCATLSDSVVHPDLIGSDIGCGMALWRVDVLLRRLRLDKAAERFARIEEMSEDASRHSDGLHDTPLPEHFEHQLGTVGGGNHFCELQSVREIVDPEAARKVGLTVGSVLLLIHSGSRGFGAAIHERHRQDGISGLPIAKGGEEYLVHHDRAVEFARENRRHIALRTLQALRLDGEALLDIPHNLAERHGSSILHRKGAAPSDRGLVPIPGSRGDISAIVEPLPSPPEALASLAHGAGRKYDRSSMEGRVRKATDSLERLTRNPFGGHVVCADRKLLIEEAPHAYKDLRRVVADLETFQLAKIVATMQPLVTFKTARSRGESRS